MEKMKNLGYYNGTYNLVEKMTVPITKPMYAILGKNVGIKAYTISPVAVTSGIILTIIFVLKYFKNAVKIRSIPSCVKKLINMSMPRSV